MGPQRWTTTGPGQNYGPGLLLGRRQIVMGLRGYFCHFFGVKTLSFWTVNIIITNTIIKFIVFFGSCFLQMPNVVDSLRNNHEESHLNLRQLHPCFNTTQNDDISDCSEQICICQSRLLTINVAIDRFEATVALWMVWFSTYGARYGESILADTHLNVLLILILSYSILHSLSVHLWSFIQPGYLQAKVQNSTELSSTSVRNSQNFGTYTPLMS